MGNFLKQNVLLIIVIFFAFIWGMLNFDILPNQGGDNARYIMLGRSILEGKFMREINTVEEDLHKQYPPLFPLVLSFVMLIFGRENIFMMKMFSLFFYLLSVFVFFHLLNKYIRNKFLNILIILLFLFARNIVEWSSLVLTESFFILLVLLIFYFFAKYQESQRETDFIIFLIFCTLSTFTRGNGAIVFIAIFLYLVLCERKKKLFLLTTIFLLISQIWAFYVYLKTGHTSSYFQQVFYRNIYLPQEGYISIKIFFQRIFLNFLTYFTTIIPRTFSANIDLKWYYVPFVIIPFSLFIGSIFVSFYEKKYIFEVSFLLLNFILLIIWPEYFSTDRFFAPFFSIFLILISVVVLKIKFKKELVLNLFYVFLIISIVLNISYLVSDIPRKMYMLSETDFNFRNDNRFRPELGIRTFFDLAIWARENTEEDAVIMTVKPELFYLYSDRKTVLFPYTYDDSTVINYMRKNNVSYVVFENTENPYRHANLTINVFIKTYKGYFSYAYTVEERPYYMLLKVDRSLYQ
ncbi:MAG: glycosyltransferase family 39 protein [candidate division WOR-3 bacterium]